MTKFLIESGAPLKALNENKETAFAIALENNHISILDILCDKVKLSEDPELLHIFKDKIFDDRYKDVLLKLLTKETT